MTRISDATCVAAYKACNEANLRTVAGLIELASQLNALATAEIESRCTVSIIKPIYVKTSWLVHNPRESKVTDFSLEQWKSSMPDMVIHNRLVGNIRASFFWSLNSNHPVVSFTPTLQQLEINHGN